MSKREDWAYSQRLPRVKRSDEIDGHICYVLTFDTIVAAVLDEMASARRHHREFASWHEYVSVVREEDEEFFDSVKRNQPDLDEILQGIACRFLALMELGNTNGERALAAIHPTTCVCDECENAAIENGYDGWAGA